MNWVNAMLLDRVGRVKLMVIGMVSQFPRDIKAGVLTSIM